MSNVEKISVALTPEMAAQVREAVNSGSYASTSEVIREALRDWQMKQLVRHQQEEEIRRLWKEGLDSGTAGEWNMSAFKKEAVRRHTAKKSEH